MNISASGMAAERQRMEVVATNLANANTTRTDDGTPFRRKNIIFAELTDPRQAQFGGVRVLSVEPDPTPFEWVHNPSHPHADENGNLLLPNVKVPNELIDLISASRSYEANLRSITMFKEMIEETLSLLNGGR